MEWNQGQGRDRYRQLIESVRVIVVTLGYFVRVVRGDLVMMRVVTVVSSVRWGHVKV
jgi:hypothetical protein